MTARKIKSIAEKKYRRYLKYVEKKIGHSNTTYSSELEKICLEEFGSKFRGIFPSDQIPVLTDKRPYCIVNLDNSKQQGSHWVGVAKIPHRKEVMFYDSFGRNSKQILPSLKRSNNGEIKDTEDDIEQAMLEDNCGNRSIGFLLVFDRDSWEYAKWI